jgi:hypothetical protein
MFVSGFMVMCACPGWFLISAIFAALAVWKSSGKRKNYAFILLALALVMTTVEVIAKDKLARRVSDLRRTHQSDARTNPILTNALPISKQRELELN